MKKILYIDMDGVMCDFDKAKKEALEKVPEITHPQCQMDFFRKLEPLWGAIECVNHLSKYYDIYFLTSPSIKNPMSYTEKMLWIRDHFDDDWVRKLIITKHKHLNKGDFLIDDRPTFNGADKFEGELIHFGSDEFSDWFVVLEYLMEHYEKMEV